MKTLLLLFTFNMCLLPLSKAQLNIELLHQLVAHSKQEYEKQQTLRSTQVVATANQEINSQQTAKLKSRYREITGQLIHRAQQLARYILGLMLTIGEINQMKQSDRRIFYAQVITELKTILSISRSLANSMYYASVLKKVKSQHAFSDFINEDKRIVERILSKIKILTP